MQAAIEVRVDFGGAYTRGFTCVPNNNWGMVLLLDETVTHTVTFDLQGGIGAFPQQVIEYGDTATEPTAEPTRAGYIFIGWHTEAIGGTRFDFNVPITADTVVYAHWELEDEDIYPHPTYEYRDIRIYYYLRDENGALSRDRENNSTGRLYTRRVGTTFNIGEDVHVLDRNTLPGENVYEFEGWLVHLGGIPNQDYIADKNTSEKYGYFIVPASAVSVNAFEVAMNIDTLNDVPSGDVIGLVAVWTLYEATDTTTPPDDDGTATTDGGRQGLPRTGIESNEELWLGLLVIFLMMTVGIIIELRRYKRKD